MKKVFIFLLLLVSLTSISFAQTAGLNFQGVARSGYLILASQKISLKFTILATSPTGTAEYTETRLANTNGQGVFSIVIGDTGAVSTLGSFANINWKLAPKFLKVELDPTAGTAFTTMGTTQLQTVPYAKYANYANSVDAANILGTVPVSLGGTGTTSISGIKTSLSLDKVNNTADADKPVSTATQTALDLKANASDVTASLAIKLNKADTSTLSNRIDLKANASDVTTSLALKLNQSDTASLSSRIDLKANASDVTTSLATKVDKVTGKEFSSNDFTNDEKTKLAAITGTNTGDQDLSSYATKTALGLKVNISDANTFLATKVDKESGKILSSNDFTSNEKTKLAAIIGTNTGDQTTITGNAGSATKLATAKTINGVLFDGSGSIIVTADATTLSGTSLKSTITSSSLTSVGTLASLTTSGKITSGAVTYPNTDGTANQVLTTSGTGNLTWTSPSSGSFVDLTTAQTIVGSKSFTSNLRVGTSTPTLTAALEVSSTTQGFLPPRMTLSQRNAITTPTAGLMIYCTNCGTYGEPEYFNGSGWKNLAGGYTAPSYSIGQTALGGKIAYILSPGDLGYDENIQHGLIISSFISSSKWWNDSSVSTNAIATAFGSGLSNTDLIISSQGQPVSTNYAAGLARSYTGGNYTDWFLPSLDELKKISNNTPYLDLPSGGYWTSSELDIDNAYVVNTGGGPVNPFPKLYDFFNVVAIRTF